jgi:DNA-binding MarR family transcriptional regulator
MVDDERSDRAGVRVSPQYVSAHPGVDPTCTELVINVLTAAGLLQNRLEALLRPLDLTLASFNLLQIVAGDREPITPSEIAARARVPVTTATMTGLLDTCQRRGWITRTPHPDDRRRVLVHVTDEGERVRAEAEALVLAEEPAWLAPTTEATRQRLIAGLGRIVDHLS